MSARKVPPIFGTSWTTAQRLGQTAENGKCKNTRSDRDHMMRRPLLIAIIAFLAALALRVANAPMAFAGGAPQISPIDELYHWKRMAFSAAHVPQVLEFDPDRAAFCPWP